ncbi:MAG: rhodanese-like domain-containing protein [Chloroflexota bacterium]|nr:rhodanese-like domain-containing protein [Chloroflexota bacterium]
MSRRPPKKVRGPSRPIDPRHAPGGPVRTGPDRFGMVLIGVTSVVILLLLAFLALRQSNPNGTTSLPVAQDQVPPAGNQGQQAAGSAPTQTEAAFATIVAPLPRISVQEARALYDAGNAKMFDVRTADRYAQQHIKGAINIPNSEAGARLADFPRAGNVILYCQ